MPFNLPNMDRLPEVKVVLLDAASVSCQTKWVFSLSSFGALADHFSNSIIYYTCMPFLLISCLVICLPIP